MTSRELRTRRRAEERKARKQERQHLAPMGAKEETQLNEETNLPTEIGFVSQKPPVAAAGRAEINRQNSQHSTGPRSPQGKLASSRNATKHGLASGQIIVPGEDPAAYDALLAALLQEHQPANTTEELLVTEMAQSHWLTQRALRLQNDCFDDNGEVDTKRLALFLRYQTTHQRAFHKALNTLLTVQKTRRKAELGFVSQTRSLATSTTGFVSQTESPNPQPGFVSQHRPATHSPEVPITAQAA